MERRLAAIMAADVVGYSRPVGLDEAGTLAAETINLDLSYNLNSLSKHLPFEVPADSQHYLDDMCRAGAPEE